MDKKKCFVMIGYGKRSYLRKKNKIRKIDLDKTYYEIIEKTFAELKREGYHIECFRSIDKNSRKTGSIDKQMYLDIYESDFVIADISTLNPNVMYELGVRHALKPHTTIIICEDKTELPFDVNHEIVDPYKHGGDGIFSHDQRDAIDKLKIKIKTLLDTGKPVIDSLVHNNLPGLIISRDRNLETPKRRKIAEGDSLGELLEQAEQAKQNEEYSTAIDLIRKALEIDSNDTFLLQRLALLTYKSEFPNPHESLIAAEKILREDLQNRESLDAETLGLSGAVYKRLCEIKNTKDYLDKALHFYGRGYFLLNDYYNGINVAFLYTYRAVYFQTEEHEIRLDFDIANRIRNEVKEICEDLIQSKDFDQRGDGRSWIYLTLAEIYFAFGKEEDEQKMITKAEEVTEGTFDLSSYKDQKIKLEEAIRIFNERNKQ